MTISAGKRLGPYEILSAIGAGGMGEVYRAKDTRLDRTVAIKVLPAQAALRDGVRERFEREARAISSLNHPHICVLHDIGQQDGSDYLVMELVEGETLAARLSKGPLPMDRVLQYAIEISDALDKAHRKGITHRDLKPSNIMLSKSGVKLLDFGLAKLKDASSARVNPETETSTEPLTTEGLILGTLQYMAPEQVEGREADSRADIFSFGAVVYEMATGKRAFAGSSQASVIAAILERTPPAISSLQPMAPPALDRVIKICLEKDPDDRWQTASDLSRELKWILSGGAQTTSSAPLVSQPATKRTATLVWAIVAACLAAVLVISWFSLHRESPAPPGIYEFTIKLPEGVRFTPSAALEMSPNGRMVAFPAIGPSGPPNVWIQDLKGDSGGQDARPLTETDPSVDPPPLFWSADSRYVVFSDVSKIRKVDVQSGAVQDIALRPSSPLGGAWGPDGSIIFGSGTSGLWRIAPGGNVAMPLTKLDASRHEQQHELPSFLPDGRHFLYLAVSSVPQESGIYAGSLDDPTESPNRKRVLDTGFGAYYSPSNGGRPGHLIFVRDGVLMAQIFDPGKLEVRGEASPLIKGVGSAYETGHFSVGPDLLVYREQSPPQKYQLSWVDEKGQILGTVGDTDATLDMPRLSPDGSQVVYVRAASQSGNTDIWVIDLHRGTNLRLTVGQASNHFPVWSPDGREIVFSSNRQGGVYDLYRKRSDGSQPEQLLLRSTHNKRATSWSRDGKYLAYSEGLNIAAEHIWILPMREGAKPAAFSTSQFDEGQAQFSPDGRFIAYTSNESGQYEVYVRQFSDPTNGPLQGGKWVVSKDEGYFPMWRADGRELAYIRGDRVTIMSMSIATGNSFQAGIPHELVMLPRAKLLPSDELAPSADLKRFLMPLAVEQKIPQSFQAIVNWYSLVKAQ